MAGKLISFKDEYTRKVGGDTYAYEVEYTAGREVTWRARITHDGILKGTPSGAIIDNAMDGSALRQYIVACIESLIERGLAIEEMPRAGSSGRFGPGRPEAPRPFLRLVP